MRHMGASVSKATSLIAAPKVNSASLLASAEAQVQRVCCSLAAKKAALQLALTDLS